MSMHPFPACGLSNEPQAHSAWLIPAMEEAFTNAASVGTLEAQGNSNALDMMEWLFGPSGSADALGVCQYRFWLIPLAHLPF